MLKKYLNFNERGEIASMLAVVSMLVIGLGLLVGYNVSQQEAAISTNPFAQVPQGRVPITQPIDRLDHVCFPYGDANNAVTDPYCRVRLAPGVFTSSIRSNADDETKRLFRNVATVNRDTVNPLIEPIPANQPNNPRTVRVTGGLCVTNEGGNTTTVDTTKVWLSLFDVRKVGDPSNLNDPATSTVVTSDINEAKSELGFIIAAEGSSRTGVNAVKLNNDSQQACTYTKGTQTYNPDFENNPVLFSFDIPVSALKAKIEQAKTTPAGPQRASALHPRNSGDPDDPQAAAGSRLFDTNDCSVYIHLDSNVESDPKDTYNIFRIPLEDIVGEAEKNRLCPQTTPTPLPSATPTPGPSATPTPTPSVTPSPTPTGTPRIYTCYEPDDLTNKGCRTKSQCADANEAGEELDCLHVNVQSSTQPQPGLPEPTGNADSSGSSNDRPDSYFLGVPTALDSCDAGETCRCLPRRCLNDDCSTYAKACLAPSPTPTPTPTTAPQACNFNALAFIEVCDDDAIQEDGSCAIDPEEPNRFKAHNIDPSELTLQWTPLNEKQREGGRYFTRGANGPVLVEGTSDEELSKTDALRFKAMSANPSEMSALIGKFKFFTGAMLNKGLTYRAFFDSKELDPGEDPLDRNANVLFNTKVDADDEEYAAERYSNFEDAEVKFYFDKLNYRVVNKGNKIYSCTNEIRSAGDDVTDYTDTSACKLISQPNTDEVHGLTVGCGQNIVYGLTLQKCDFNYDYLFIVDTSTSMKTTDPVTGKSKIQSLKDSLTQELVPDVRNGKGTNSRFSMITFNSGPAYYENKDQFIPVDGFIDFDSPAVDTAINNLTAAPSTQEGTCFQCALELAQEKLDARPDKTRKPVIVLLTDGNPNSKLHDNGNGTRGPVPNEDQLVINMATQMQSTIDDLTFVVVGYGDATLNDPGSFEGQRFEAIKGMASPRRSDLTKKWAYSTNTELSRAEGGGSINEIMADLQQQLNSCETANLAQRELLRAKDVNKDGIINAVDLLLIYDNYFARGDELAEDVNTDAVVNALDSSLVIEDLGTVVEPDPTGSLTTPSGIDTTPGSEPADQ